MKYFSKGLIALAIFVAVISTALTAAAQAPDDVEYWNAQWEGPAACFPNTHGTITDDGLAVILSEYDPSWGGDRWEGLVVYAGDDFLAYQSPDAGVPYPAPNDAPVTNYISCKGETPTETTTTTTTSTTAAPEETTTTTAAPEETTTTTSSTAAPAGGVAAGAGGTAGSDQSLLWVLGGVAAIAAVMGAGYIRRQRSES